MGNIVLIGKDSFSKNGVFDFFMDNGGLFVDSSSIQCLSYNLLEKIFYITNLPECLSLVSVCDTNDSSKLISSFLLNNDINLILNVIDVKNLNSELYLTLQLIEQFDIPIVIVLTNFSRIDVSRFDLIKLSNILRCNFFLFDFTKENFFLLKKNIIEIVSTKISESYRAISVYNRHKKISYFSDSFNFLIFKILDNLKENVKYAFNKGSLIRILEGDFFLKSQFDLININFIRKIFFNLTGDQIDVYVAKSRHAFIFKILGLLKGKNISNKISIILDNFFLNRVFALPLFFLVIYIMFVFTIDVGSFLKDFFDFFGQAILIEGVKELMIYFCFPYWMISIFSNGFFSGLNMVLSFIPVLTCMFFFLSLLEHSGYVPRAAFIIDKLMRIIGLPSKSFVPMIIGFGCNVPAILSTRNFNNRGEKVLTIIMTPFISCNARLAIYTVFVSVFYGTGGGNVIFFLYLIGILVAVFTGLIVKRFFFKGESKLIIEFPLYRFPRFNIVLGYVFSNLRNFLSKAGSIIIPISIFISFIGLIEKNLSFIYFDSVIKKTVVFFKPMGIKDENWPAIIALTSGVISKEVMIGTLDALYRYEIKKNCDDIVNNDTSLSLLMKIHASSFVNLLSVRSSIDSYNNIINASYVDKDVSKIMYRKFGGPIEAFSYLLFVLLYFPCIPVIATISKELDKYWACFSIIWCTVVSYSVSVLFYQIITFDEHSIYSLECIFIIFFVFILLFSCLKFYFNKYLYF
ncbi:MAG TPA: ferrous iron transport protein B [Candidatus Azoamicus sp. OHIO1]